MIDLNGQRVMVKDHYHHSAMTGMEYDANAELVEKAAPEPRPKATPPNFETVLAAGYSEAAAKMIAAEEQFKFEHGAVPYGDIPLSDEFLEQMRANVGPGLSEPPAQEIVGAEAAGDDEAMAEALFGKKGKK
jgi:hypothetical protein